MDYVVLSTHFFGTAQDMDISANGTRYYVAISKGGYKYRDTEYEDEAYDQGISPMFDDYEKAFEFYAKLLKAFGGGWYDWEERKNFVVNGTFCTEK